jgi:hypothetical protein
LARFNSAPCYIPYREIFEEGNQDLTEEVIAQLPRDGAAQIDHYLYGKPKQ